MMARGELTGELPRIVIGRETADFLLVEPTGRQYPNANDYWDGNWVDARVVIRAGAFRARLAAQLHLADLVSFRDGLANLSEHLDASAELPSLDEWLKVRVVGDRLGHFRARCEACDNPGIGNRLTFELEFDQTELPAIVRGLDEILAAYPIRGEKTER